MKAMQNNSKEFKIIRRETPYQGFFRLEKYRLKHTLFAGGWTRELDRELFRRGNCVAVLLYDPKRDEIILIEQFRVGAILHQEQPWLLEIVAGAIEEGETAEQVAYRESREEAGCEIQEILKISEFYTTPGGSSERISLFCGRVDAANAEGIHGLDDEDEDILVRSVPFKEACSLVEQGKIDSAIPILAIQWLALNHSELRKKWLAE